MSQPPAVCTDKRLIFGQLKMMCGAGVALSWKVERDALNPMNDGPATPVAKVCGAFI